MTQTYVRELVTRERAATDLSAKSFTNRIAVRMRVAPIHAHLRVIIAIAVARTRYATCVWRERDVRRADRDLPGRRRIGIEPHSVLRPRHFRAVDAETFRETNHRRASGTGALRARVAARRTTVDG